MLNNMAFLFIPLLAFSGHCTTRKWYINFRRAVPLLPSCRHSLLCGSQRDREFWSVYREKTCSLPKDIIWSWNSRPRYISSRNNGTWMKEFLSRISIIWWWWFRWNGVPVFCCFANVLFQMRVPFGLPLEKSRRSPQTMPLNIFTDALYGASAAKFVRYSNLGMGWGSDHRLEWPDFEVLWR